MSGMDLDNFVFAGDEDIAGAIESDEAYTDQEILADEEVGGEEESPQDEEAAEVDSEEDTDSEEEVVEAQEEEVEEGLPPKTGNKAKDGLAKAIYEQRKKRREAEANAAKLKNELAYLKGKLEAGAKQQVESPKAPVEDLPPLEEFDYADLEKSVENRFRQLRKHELALQRQQEAQVKTAEWQETLNSSVAEARVVYEDYDTVETAFAERLKGPEGNHLKPLLLKQPDPATWVYKTQKRYEAAQEKKANEKEDLQKQIADLQKQLKDGKRPSPRKSLASARGSSPRKPGKNSPDTADDVFKDLFSRK